VLLVRTTTHFSERTPVVERCISVYHWITKAINTHTHTEYVIRILLHVNSGYANTPQCYVIGTLPVLLVLARYGSSLVRSVTFCRYDGIIASTCHTHARSRHALRRANIPVAHCTQPPLSFSLMWMAWATKYIMPRRLRRVHRMTLIRRASIKFTERFYRATSLLAFGYVVSKSCLLTLRLVRSYDFNSIASVVSELLQK